MVDALHAEQVEGLAHEIRAALLPGVGDQPEAFGRGPLVHLREQRGRIADLGGVEPDADELVPEHQRRAERVGGFFRAVVPQEAEDQVGRDPVIAPGVGQRGGQAAEHRGQRHPVVNVGLRVEEDLGPADADRDGAGQVGLGQVVEVLLVPQDLEIRVVQVQEALQVAEAAPGPQFGHVRGRQGDAVACRQADQELGLQRAFDVQVQLGNGQHGRDSAARTTARSA